ncbi:ribosome biogenesis GTPase Der [candidate division WOR-3 bacterium]|nr:ribosome biogenesis GTPase Der [candidate division WOR-3 bacterium]
MNTIAIVGKPNVGKSTLFNRLLNKKSAIVDKQPGVTRDRVYGVVEREGKPLILIDTGGLLFSGDPLETQIREQVIFALEEADIVLLLVDGKEGITSLDRKITEYVRKARGKKALVINKMDKGKDWSAFSDLGKMVLDKNFQISAQHNYGVENLLKWILSNCEEGEIAKGTTIGVIGKPNTGKSTYVNAIMGYERTITKEEPGTTRDSTNSYLEYNGRTIVLVDTAGLKRKSKLKDSLEYYSFLRAIRTIEESDIVLVLVDSTKKVSKQDKNIIRWAIDRGTPLIILLSKFDLVPEEKTEKILKYYDRELSIFDWIPRMSISSLKMHGIEKSLATALEIVDKLDKKKPELESVVKKAIAYRPPPGSTKKVELYSLKEHRGKITLNTNADKNFDEQYRRYLENRIRKNIDFKGIPISLKFKRG